MRIVLDLPEDDLTAAAWIEGVDQPTQMQAAVLHDLVVNAQVLVHAMKTAERIEAGS